MSFVLAALFALNTFAQNPESEPIVVTAPSETHIRPVDLFSEDELLEIPNLNFAGGTNHVRYLQIRGVGETGVYENTPSHSVSYFIEGIDLSGIAASWPALNIAQTTIAKGPQSVFWGGASTGGVIHTEFTAVDEKSRAQISYATGNTKQAGIDASLFNKSRIFLYHNNSKGFFKNTFNGRPGAAQDEYYVSLKNQLLKNENWRISSSHIGVKNNNAFDTWSLNNNFKTQSDRPGEDALALHGHALKISRALGETSSLESLSSAAFSNSTYSYDSDWGNNPYWQNIPGWNQNYDYFDKFLRRREAWHQKLYYQRDLSSAGFHFYGLNEKSDIENFKNGLQRRILFSDYKSVSSALFFDVHYPLTATQSLQVAGRGEVQKMKYSDSHLVERETHDRFAAAHLEWRNTFALDHFIFGRINTGFKSAGVNIDSTVSEANRFYKPEKVLNFEIGARRRSAKFVFDANLFYASTQQKQVKVSEQNDPTDPSSYSYFTANAARTTSYGLESGLDWQSNGWRAQAQLGLLNTEFKNYSFEGRSLGGRDVAHAPHWMGSFALAREFTQRFSGHLVVIGKDRFYFSNNHGERSSPMELVNVGMTYEIRSWTYNLWAKNIFNERYETRGFYFANEPPDWNNKLYTQSGNPRQFGGSLTYAF